VFFRLYLVLRFALYHSRLIHNVGSRSVGYINQVSITFSFLIKTYLTEWPIICLLVFCMTILLIGSWALRVCDYDYGPSISRVPYAAAIWFFVQIFTTLGYGNVIPSTFCSRSKFYLFLEKKLNVN
jgi:hypothetical protein